MFTWLIPIIIIGFIAIICIRVALFNPKTSTRSESREVNFDEELAINALQQMIECKTISDRDKSLEDDAEFDKFQALLPMLFPLLHKTCTLEHIGKRGLLYHLKGKSDQSPTVYMAHYDVVPADDAAWQHPPFEALRENGEIWGRGTLDTKGTLCSALVAIETLLKDGFVPANDIYFAFGGDEEIMGFDAPAIVDALYERGIHPALVLDEGGAIVENVFPGVTSPCALIGTAEKGMINLEFSAKSSGGHASAPPPHTIVGLLAQAVTRIENKPFPAHLSPPVAEMFDTLGRHSSFVYKLIFANLWCFKGVLNTLCKKTGGEMNALMRTTCAFTKMSGGTALNVLASNASVNANLRLMNPDTTDSAKQYIENVVNDKNIQINVIDSNNPSPYSPSNSDGYARVRSAINQTWPEAIVSPYLMVACSDSRHFTKISDNVLRFSAMELSNEDRKRIHGHDERIKETTFFDAIRFYLRIIQES